MRKGVWVGFIIAVCLFLLAFYFYQSSYQSSSDLIVPECKGSQEIERCYVDYAIQNKNPSICQDVSQESIRNSCYDQLASRLNREDLCREITDIDMFSVCLIEIAKAKKDSVICDGVDASYSDQCYLLVAVSIPNPDICNKIINEQVREESCRSRILN